MKGGRSHRLEPPPLPLPPPAPAADEWGDGSWTVDCSCGVTFDDGEEMVSCDECGVWVHTRCARYVHSARGSFSCHNCKSKNATDAAAAAAAADAADAEEAEVAELLAELPTKSPAAAPLGGHRAPSYRRWAEVPLPDRVHVHGPPGGDPGLFRGLLASSAFSAALWRCAGYVPKKFGFRYREFPSWYADDDGVDALFALAKEKGKEMVEAGPLSLGRMGKMLDPGSGGRKQKHHILATGAAGSGKKKDEGGEGRESGAKRKPSNDAKKRGGLVPIAKSDTHEDVGCQQVGEFTVPDGMSDDKKFGVYSETNMASSNLQLLVKVEKVVEESLDPSGEKSSEELPVMAKKDEPMDSLKMDISSGIRAISAGEEHKIHSGVLKVEVKTKASNSVQLSMYKQHTEGSYSGGPRSRIMNTVVNMEDDQPSAGATTFHTCAEKTHEVSDHLHIVQKQSSQFSGSLQDIGNVPNLPFGQTKSQNIKSEADSQDHERTTEDIEFRDDEQKSNKQNLCDSAGSLVIKNSSESAHHTVPSEHAKSETQIHTHPVPDCPKSILSPAKVSSSSSGPVYSHFDSSRALGSTEPLSTGKTVRLIKHEQTKLLSAADGKNDSTKSVVVAEGNSLELARRSEKAQTKCSLSSAPKSSSQASKTYLFSTKHRLVAPKDQVQKISATGDTPARTFQGEVTSLQSRGKPVSPSFSQKKEKIHHRSVHITQESPNNSTPMDLQASDATASLSDEQLALLLHHQLNSSPRVPRVTRGHQAVGMQMLHPTGATVFSKRSSAHGGRDQALVLKKRNKDDVSRDNYMCNDDTRRMGKVSFVDQRHRDSTTAELGPSAKDSCRLAENTQPKQQNLASSTEVTAGSGWDDSMDGAASRNLPGLIDEIFTKNRNITYAELCDAVRPHWKDLRKPNGERYAYPSYLHAVNDCLRNRSEWAHLVDQAPKMNSNKRRKVDGDSMLAEKTRNKAERDLEERSAESHREDLPRGKRKARRRRRLELQGRRVKDVRKRSGDDSSSGDAVASSDSGSDINETPTSEESQENKSADAENGADVEAESTSSSSSDSG